MFPRRTGPRTTACLQSAGSPAPAFPTWQLGHTFPLYVTAFSSTRARFIISPTCRREQTPAQLGTTFLFCDCSFIYFVKATSANVQRRKQHLWDQTVHAPAGCRRLAARPLPSLSFLLSLPHMHFASSAPIVILALTFSHDELKKTLS